MKDSRKHLLRLIYENDQNGNESLQICADGESIGSDRLSLRHDVEYLKRNGFIVETMSVLQSYCLALTNKGESYVENDFRMLSEQPNMSNYNFGGATIQNAVIGNGASDNDFTINSGSPIADLQKLFIQRPAEEQTQLSEIINLLHKIDVEDTPVTKSTFAKIADFLNEHNDLVGTIGTALMKIFVG